MEGRDLIQKFFKTTSYKRFFFFFISDIILIILSLLLSFLIHFDFNLNISYNSLIIEVGFFFIAIKLVAFSIFKIYRITWRYVGINDLMNLFIALVFAEMLLIVLSLNTNLIPKLPITGMPKRIFFVDGILSLCLIGGLRISKRMYLEIIRRKGPITKGKRTLIVGAGNTGDIIVRDMKRQDFSYFYPVVFLDDDKTKVGTYINGVKVLGSIDMLKDAISQYSIEAVIIAIPNLNHKMLRKIYNVAKKEKVPIVKVVPRIYDFDRPDINLKRLEDISIEDLVGRQIVTVDYREIRRFIEGKTVCVTGAGGSIGSELVMQLCSFEPKDIILFDIDETELHNIGLRINRLFPHLSGHAHYITGDVRDRVRIHEVLTRWRPHIIFHSAAYKHVPMMEYNPKEAIKVNIMGTYNLAQEAILCGVEKFIMISTDKAVRPTSVMGATKRMAEEICKAFNENGIKGIGLISNSFGNNTKGQEKEPSPMTHDPSPLTHHPSPDFPHPIQSSTRFISVRFGNVLGSRGSVLPLFLEQLKFGGPLTLTHEDMRRYFMTIPEAVSLVLQASIIGEGGEVLVLDMGELVSIKEIAEELIRIHGLEPYKDIDIHITGLRPGEKLFEEILTAEEGTVASKHEKVFIARSSKYYSLTEIEKILQEFKAVIEEPDIDGEKDVRNLLRQYVPYYEEK